MVILAAIGGGVFVLAASIIGVRLLWLSSQTRQLPEFTMGLGLFLMGGLGYPLTLLAAHMTDWSDGVRGGLIIANQVFAIIGMTAIATFTWRVFHPKSNAACALVVLICVSMTSLFLAQGMTAGWVAFAKTGTGPFSWSSVISIVALGWAGIESLRYRSLMSKRLALGLADPVLVDRFRQWAIGTLAATFITIVSFGLSKMGVDMRGSAAGALLVGPLGLVSAVTMGLAFLPPKSYLDWIRRRHAARAEA